MADIYFFSDERIVVTLNSVILITSDRYAFWHERQFGGVPAHIYIPTAT